MKIQDNGPLDRSGGIQPEPAQAQRPAPVTGSAVERTDNATLSSLTEKVLSAKDERIEELKRLHEAGAYLVSADELAAKLIEEHKAR